MAKQFIACSIEGCNGDAGRDARGCKGFCQKHYFRLRRTGDPLATKSTPPGEVQKYYRDVVLQYEGEECLIWPFGSRESGYVSLRRCGVQAVASRVLCEDVNGLPPTSHHQAAHSCGNGHLGCMTKRHLSWKTPTENQADRIVHGTHHRGELCSSSKLTNDQAKEVLSLKGKKSTYVIARMFGVDPATIGKIHNGKNWAWLQDQTATIN